MGDQADGEPSGLHQASPAIANQLNDFVRGRQPARLLLGIDFLLVNENVQCAWPAQTDASGNLQFAFDALFQAHGPHLDVASKETALDFDHHSGLLQILPPTSITPSTRWMVALADTFPLTHPESTSASPLL